LTVGPQLRDILNFHVFISMAPSTYPFFYGLFFYFALQKACRRDV
jgi:hypothetical protein